MKMHSRILSMAMALMLAISCAVIPALASPASFSYDIDGHAGQLMITIFDKDGNLVSSNLARDARANIIPAGGVMVMGDRASGGRLVVNAGQALTLTLTTSSPALIDMGYDRDGDRTYTSYASSAKTVTSAVIRVPTTGNYYFIGKNIGVTSINLVNATLN